MMQDIGKNMAHLLHQKNYYQEYEQMVNKINENPEIQAFLKQNADHLTTDDIQRSYAQLYEYIQQKEKFLSNDPTMIAPGYEPKLRLHHHAIEVTYVPTDELLARKNQEKINDRIQTVFVPKMIKEASFDLFENTSGRADALLAVADFVNHYCPHDKIYHPGLYLVGGFGVGKTYLLGATAKRLAEDGYQTMIVHFPTFAVEMKQAIGKDTLAQQLNQVKNAPILMIDDIGADAMSSWIRDDILGVILQHRMQEMLPTFFSSNFSMAELERHLTVSQKGDQEPIKAMRIMERIRYLSKEVLMSGENRRNPK